MLDWTFNKLVKLLERERNLLTVGDVSGASDLADEKERLLAKIDLAALSPDRLQALKDAAARNDRLIAAAREGISAARDRLRQIRLGSGIRTYGAQGQRETIRPTQTSLHKRA